MPVVSKGHGAAAKHRIEGLYRHLYNAAVEDADRIDARLVHQDFVPKTDAAGRRQLNSTSPVTVAAGRRVRSFAARAPQLVQAIAVSPLRFPDVPSVPFLAKRQPYDETPGEYNAGAWLLRVYADDRVEVAMTRGQMLDGERPPIK